MLYVAELAGYPPTEVRPEVRGGASGEAFPGLEQVIAAAAEFDRREPWDGSEGPRPVLTVAPGVVSLHRPDVARRERAAERAREKASKWASEQGYYRATYGKDMPTPKPTRVISEWSRQSRSRMVKTLAQLDCAPLLDLGLSLPMTTLTYPADWLTVAPSGAAVKRHMQAFWKRFAAAWGFEWPGIWKLEFQHRGAPHVHLWGPQPAGAAGDCKREAKVRRRFGVGDGLPYAQWLSVVWADVVGHPDAEERRKHERAGTAVDLHAGARMVDPKRMAVYFSKHGSYGAKEYQHEVPVEWREPGKTPGRFWGYRGLKKATVDVEMTPADALFVGRTLRRLSRAQGVTRQVRVPRGLSLDTQTGEIRQKYRTVRRPAVRLASGAGFLCVNDGPALAVQLARALKTRGFAVEWDRAQRAKAESAAAWAKEEARSLVRDAVADARLSTTPLTTPRPGLVDGPWSKAARVA